jgi:hypothetical protein
MGFIQREVKQRGRDVIIAIDTSRSMLATDVAPSRLARAKLVAQDLLRLVRGDRLGLIAFAGSAFLQAPLTLDYSAVLASLDELDTAVIPKGGTNIAEAIRMAEQAFGKGEGHTRALIILTDGEELDADGVSAAKRAAALGVRIFTVGIGSGEGSLIPFRTEGGEAEVLVRGGVKVAVAGDIDPVALGALALVDPALAQRPLTRVDTVEHIFGASNVNAVSEITNLITAQVAKPVQVTAPVIFVKYQSSDLSVLRKASPSWGLTAPLTSTSSTTPSTSPISPPTSTASPTSTPPRSASGA